ncbi:MAG: hypothetical protein Q8N34_03180 [Gammaproteobacteria bacterium]|nr:hypothetical protein [Gammaproteobacteria bacterium]
MHENSIELNLEDGEFWQELSVPISDVSTKYLVDNVVVEKPSMSITITELPMTIEDTLTISGIPVGATLHYPGGSIVVDDGEVEWDTVAPGTYIFTIELFPFLTERIHAEVTDA